MSSITKLVAMGVLLVPSLAHAQGNSDVAHQREECRLAAQIVATGRPAPHDAWALSYIGRCGGDGGAALAAGLRALRTSRDTTALGVITAPTLGYRDAALFQAELDVAGDPTASVPARVFAFRSLTSLLHPERHLTYASVAGPLDESGLPTAGCGVGSIVSDPLQLDGTPLPTDFAQQIRALSDRVWRDTAAAVEVRSAAFCAR
jgi:hypothetical protein